MEEQREKYHDILKKYWGYTDFRTNQLEVIESVASGWDTLALMPTGAGKSLLYQVPALAAEGVCIVISPLVALMKDQVDRLRSLGIPAAAIHSSLSPRQIDITMDNASWGDLKFLYVAPERLSSPVFRERVARMDVSLVAIDEAHCISQWGYDFRPSYLNIGHLRDIIPGVVFLALTASATPVVADDIMRHLRMKEGRIIRNSFARPNISYAVRRTDDKQGQLLRVLRNVRGSGIVYVRLREETEKIAAMLRENGIEAGAYHAGMGMRRRTEAQEQWLKGGIQVMVCTNAFGMGIDKPDVRVVVHYDICDSPESYYQESGRAGRDGRRSYAVLLAGSDDRGRASRMFTSEFPPLEKIKACYEALFNYLQIGIGDGKYYMTGFDIYDFAVKNRMHQSTAYNALKILQQNGYLTLSPVTDNPPRIQFIISRDDLYKVRIDREELDHILRTILRLYAGVFGDRLVPVDENELAFASGYTPEKVHELLQKLWRLRVIRYVPGSRSPVLLLTEERLPAKDVYISPESYRIRKEMAAQRLRGIHEYADGKDRCRQVYLREYFGEADPEECGVCDICLERKKKGVSEKEIPENQYSSKSGSAGMIEKDILDSLESESRTVKELVALFTTGQAGVVKVIDSLLEEGKISCRGDGKLVIKE